MAKSASIKDAILSQIAPVLKKECKKYYTAYAKGYAEAARKEYTSAAEKAINEFYLAYDPKYYDRTFDLLKNSYEPYYDNHGNRIDGGVKISPDNMSDYATSYSIDENMKVVANNSTPKEEVFERTWYGGYHGDPNNPHFDSGAQQTTPPIDIFLSIIKQGSVQNRIQVAARRAAQNQSYSILDKFFT